MPVGGGDSSWLSEARDTWLELGINRRWPLLNWRCQAQHLLHGPHLQLRPALAHIYGDEWDGRLAGCGQRPQPAHSGLGAGPNAWFLQAPDPLLVLVRDQPHPVLINRVVNVGSSRQLSGSLANCTTACLTIAVCYGLRFGDMVMIESGTPKRALLRRSCRRQRGRGNPVGGDGESIGRKLSGRRLHVLDLASGRASRCANALGVVEFAGERGFVF